jgi:hypothetical protein
VGVGLEAVIPNHDLALVGDMGGDPGNELQVIHPLRLGAVFAMPVADLAFPFIEGESFQGKDYRWVDQNKGRLAGFLK